MRYLPNTDADRQEMLQAIGAASMEDILSEIPEEVRFRGHLDIPGPMAELYLRRHMGGLAAANRCLDELMCFAGGGSYDHFVPSVVDHVLSRGEFYTAYTPYQAEISQGTLQAIYEFQTMIAELTGMDAANASLYDGGSALAEAALMVAAASRGRAKILVSSAVNPLYIDVIETYIRGRRDLSLVQVPVGENGTTDAAALERQIGTDTAAVLIQQPNFFGCIESGAELADAARVGGAALVVCADPISLGLLKSPGDYGADVVVGEGQSLGNHPSWGGPGLGFFAAREKYLRQMPGRIVGATVDSEGRRGFTLTLQTREQHIRRARATSNICSNQALNALAAAVYLALAGKQGITGVADLCLSKAHYAFECITALPGFNPVFSAPFFKEFAVECPLPAQETIDRLLPAGVLAGVDLGRFFPERCNQLLIAVTEKRTRGSIDLLVRRLGELA